MKKTINKINMVLAVLMLSFTITVTAQNNPGKKSDTVYFLNGAVKEGKVVALNDEKIQFIHRGETLTYEFSKREIEKIGYASGREELITMRKPVVPVEQIISRNKAAVLPLLYIGDESDNRAEEMSFQLQDIASNYLSKSAAELKFMDPSEVNALLLRKGITGSTIRQYTPSDLASLLHVEYIIMGSVLQDKGSMVTVFNSNSSSKQTIDQYGRKIKITDRNNDHGSAATRQNVETQVTLSIYNESGEKIYTKSRQSLLSEPDAYKNTIHYLLKRTPLYKR